jgi:hypothetical protein
MDRVVTGIGSSDVAPTDAGKTGRVRNDAFGGMYDALSRIGGRAAQTLIGPTVQIIECVDDAATELAIGGTGAIAAVFFEGAAGKSQIARGFLCPQKPGRQTIRGICHVRILIFIALPVGDSESAITLAEKMWREG